MKAPTQGRKRRRRAPYPPEPSPLLLTVLQQLGRIIGAGDAADLRALRGDVADYRQRLETLNTQFQSLSAALLEAQAHASRRLDALQTQQATEARRRLDEWIDRLTVEMPQIPLDKPHIERAARAQADRYADAQAIAELNDMLAMAIADNEDAAAELAGLEIAADDEAVDATPGDDELAAEDADAANAEFGDDEAAGDLGEASDGNASSGGPGGDSSGGYGSDGGAGGDSGSGE